MKKLFTILLSCMLLGTMCLGLTACAQEDTIYVNTNAYFAPFEYYEGDQIVGVDVDIMNKVGEKLGKKVVIENTDFNMIIDNVASGKKYDCGAAGITITETRLEQVDFSTPYFTSIQYVIVKTGDMVKDGTNTAGDDYVLWQSLAGKKIGVQLDTTGHIYLDGEINAQQATDGYDGALYGTSTECITFDSAEVAVAALGTSVDAVIVDKIPAEYLVNNNEGLVCFALHYDAETATEEQYAICVTKGNTELLNAINEVLNELGEEGINELVAKHLGLN